MLDFRILTFLALCRCGSYTKTAAKLHMTQPAVTQHIQYLERQFHVKLFRYASKELRLTEQGKLVYEFASSVETNLAKLHDNIMHAQSGTKSISLGTTENIGEYIMPDIMAEYLASEQCDKLKFLLGSTDYLLQLLQEGQIHFAIVDGQFDKNAYRTDLLFTEKTMVICSPHHPYAGKDRCFNDLFEETLVVRAQGSTPRTIIEQYLRERNQSIDNFHNYIEINHLNIMKKFVQKGLGIAFLYNHAVKDDIENGLLGCIHVSDFNMNREINYVELKGDYFSDEYKTFLMFCRKQIEEAFLA